MSLHDPVDGCQSNAIAGKFGSRVQAMERLKKTIGGSLIETATIVFHEIDNLIVLDFAPEIDAAVLVMGGIFPSILQEVVDHDLE